MDKISKRKELVKSMTNSELVEFFRSLYQIFNGVSLNPGFTIVMDEMIARGIKPSQY